MTGGSNARDGVLRGDGITYSDNMMLVIEPIDV